MAMEMMRKAKEEKKINQIECMWLCDERDEQKKVARTMNKLMKKSRSCQK
jgi:hypothetical protein